MSHFAVMVIGPDVKKQLAPYHEFECTGTVDEYVQNIDELEETRAGYETGHQKMAVNADGERAYPWDDRFYRDPTQEELDQVGHMSGTGCGPGLQWTTKDWGDGLGRRVKVRFLPDGWQLIEVPLKELGSLRDYIQDQKGDDLTVLNEGDEPDLNGECKWGWMRVNADGEVIELIRRTNPNNKWDWWQVGGRYSGALLLKNGATGTWGERSWTNMNEADDLEYCDSANKGNIDLAGMRDRAGKKAADSWDRAQAAKVSAGLPADSTWEPWDVVRERHQGNMQAARDEYHAQPAKKAVADVFDNPFYGVDDLLAPRDAYIQAARDEAAVFYAIVKDGEWIAKGEMGWFGMSDDAVSQDDWNKRVNEMLDGLSDDTLITIVDCHI